jgi:YHS domain-containing protein
VLWNGGISFGGVIAFIFADLIILPILNIYRKYYGRRMSLYLLAVSYATMAVSGFVVGVAFNITGLTPAHHGVRVLQSHPEWNYTTFLDIAFLALILVLGYRFLKSGGPEMLRMMEVSPDQKAAMATDPVCGMTVDPATAKEISTHAGEAYYFCSPGCRQEFEAAPEKYIGAASAPAHSH